MNDILKAVLQRFIIMTEQRASIEFVYDGKGEPEQYIFKWASGLPGKDEIIYDSEIQLLQGIKDETAKYMKHGK